ncbi:MAG: cyanophycinase [Pirellulales bacterium]|nr:cyanophycinase [Pirellulales bacterium]
MSNRLLMKCFLAVAVLVNIAWASSSAVAQKFDEKFEDWPIDLKINGRIIVDNGAQDLQAHGRLLESIGSESNIVCFSDNSSPASLLATALKERDDEDGSVKAVNYDEGFPASKLKEALQESDVVVLQTGSSFRENLEALGDLKADFDSFIGKGGTLVADQSTAELLGEYFVKQDSAGQASQVAPGLHLLPDCVLHCGFDNSSEARAEILSVLAKHPRCVGIGLEDDSVLMLAGRKMTCQGSGDATFMLMANERMPLRTRTIRGQRNRVDLTQWRLDAIDRTLDAFPTAEPETPFLDNGTLVIVGGGGMPRGLMRRFVELAGGVENAKLVYVPCSEADSVGERQGTVSSWKRMGVKSATFIHTKDREKANSDEEFLAPLKDATGVWFGGGRQWNLADSYYGTEAHRLMKEVLQRGGVVGGSSAGASIQARYLARANTVGNLEIIAPGYERGGLGFISGVAIDQHFSQRGRQKDMTQLVNKYPQLLGIGLDEATAIVVQKSNAEVVGRGRAHFYNRELPVYPDKPDFIALPDGSSYDLAERKVLTDTSEDGGAAKQ